MTTGLLPNIPIMVYLIIGNVGLALFGNEKTLAVVGARGVRIPAFKQGVTAGQQEIEDATAEGAKEVTPGTKMDKA